MTEKHDSFCQVELDLASKIIKHIQSFAYEKYLYNVACVFWDTNLDNHKPK